MMRSVAMESPPGIAALLRNLGREHHRPGDRPAPVGGKCHGGTGYLPRPAGSAQLADGLDEVPHSMAAALGKIATVRIEGQRAAERGYPAGYEGTPVALRAEARVLEPAEREP